MHLNKVVYGGKVNFLSVIQYSSMLDFVFSFYLNLILKDMVSNLKERNFRIVHSVH